MKKVLLTSVALTAMSAASAQAVPVLVGTGHYNGSDYEIWKEFATWERPDAVAFGGSTGNMHLATLQTEGEQDFVYDLIQNYIGHDLVWWWLGGSDAANEGDWRWTADGSNDPFTYTNWAPGEPNNFFNEDYLYMYGATGRWNDAKEDANIWGAVYEKKKVPEPGAVGLIGLGLLGLGAAARRRKAA